MSEESQSFKESVVEILMLVKTCLTSFWYWLPVMYVIFFFIQIWMFFFIHPLTLLILPGVLSIYSVLQREKRFKLQYGLSKNRRTASMNTLGFGPAELTGAKWDVEKNVAQYKRSLERPYENEE